MNKRIVLWIVFLMSLLLLWENWQRFNGNPSMFFASPTQVVKKDALQTDPANPTVAAVDGSTPGVTDATAVPLHGEVITIVTDVFKVEIDTLGGELSHLELLKQKEGADTSFGSGWKSLIMPNATHTAESNVVLFDRSEKRTYLAQSGLLGNYPNHKSLFVAKPGLRTLDAAGQVQLVLESEQNGVKLVKTYTFKKGSYSIDLSHQVVNDTAAPITPSVYMQLVRDGGKLEGESRFYSTFTGPAVFTEEEKFQKLTFDKIEKHSETHALKADNGWIAMIQHYFVSGIIPQDKVQREIFTKKVDTNLYAVGNIMTMGTLAPGASETLSAQIYSGPLVTSILDHVAPGFNLVKDYGWTTIVAKPVFWLMDEIHNVLGNWGWTIIVLTIFIKLAFFPLSAASFRSMGKMKLLTPKMTAIRERHKEDPQKMNQAMMELYKTEKVNPLGGCLPILIQTPVFMALYSVVLASVELRNAPWLGWIHDLSTPDPFLILPILMAVSMFIQTKLNPAPADPMQAKMMAIMPLVFSVMFFFFPSGLVLYWVINNVLSIAQQWVITKNIAAAK
ncbi:membrane protein insertase YidC [Solimicrobium silvestre]|uniref:Membrane protein insertase YidC n=1 Tax=Solimicrobium silvestre TaxID=2099400 RepID=A0A2S9H216_9BURK|nr:membrane protein insertase YidC [Solimicrobium silvestre]PRC94031.1 Membrane protein insertase, YidC/Oxa1 family, N-terminal domain [Solimicrobium silvestre]